MLGKTFRTILDKEGFLIAYLRGHRASRNSHTQGGTYGAVKCRGTDEFGNQYYEDLDFESGKDSIS